MQNHINTKGSTKNNKLRDVRIGYQPGKSSHNNVIQYLEEHLHSFPERAALRWVESKDIGCFEGGLDAEFEHKEVTYKEFATGINTVAAGLKELGIAKDDRVIIFLPMGVPMYSAMFAVQKLGAIAVFLDSWARRNHLGASADCVDPKAMISHDAAFKLVDTVPEFSNMKLRILAGPGEGKYDAHLEQLFQARGEVDIEPVESEDTALITFTTGSSGTPKGANRTHRFLSAQHEALSEVVPYTAGDLDMPAFPIFSLNNLASGVSTLLPAINLAAPSGHDAAAMVNQIIHQRVSCATLSPAMLNGVSAYCLQNAIKLPGLRRVVTGGAPISRDNVRDFKSIAPESEVWVLYGSTEVEPMAHIEAIEMLAQKGDVDPEVVEDGVNVGHISEDLEYKFIKIVKGPVEVGAGGWSDLEVEPGKVGEFIVTGNHVCRDYYNNPGAFKKAKIMGPGGKVWHRTGDLAKKGSDGYLWIVGRIHNAIDRSGEYFFPVRAEILLKRLDFVKQGAFLGISCSSKGEANGVAIALNDQSVDKAKVLRETERVFAKNKIPVDHLYIVDEIPMDPRHHSKVEYAVLRGSILDKKLPNLKV